MVFNDSKINLIPHKLKFINYSNRLLNTYRDINKLSENNRSIPNIYDDGEIDGMNLMVNVE